jgi:hypothetical protein
VRIRRLNVRLKLTAKDLLEESLATAWAQALTQALFERLALSSSNTDHVVCATSIAEFHAAFLRDLLAGKAAGRWEYAEFAELLALPISEAILQLILVEPSEIRATLATLDRAQSLERTLALLDELALERLFAAVIRTSNGIGATVELTPADLLWVLNLIPQEPGFAGSDLEIRRMALRLFVKMPVAAGRSPRVIFHSLLALRCLLECPDLLEQEHPARLTLLAALEGRRGRTLSNRVSALLLDLPRTDGLLATLREIIATRGLSRPPLTAPSAAKADWLEMEAAGLLLLAPVIIRLGWHRLRDGPRSSRWSEPRFFQILLAGVGIAILDDTLPQAKTLAPAVSVLAGIEHKPDLSGMQDALTKTASADFEQLKSQLLPEETGAPSGAAHIFDRLAAKLISEFTSLIPGFRATPRPAIVRQFLRTRGRVQFDTKFICVSLEPSPFHVALRIANLDAAVPVVNWMGDRRLEFRLSGV